MTERLLITKLIRTDETRADLFAKGHRYKDLTLFDLSDLALVGIDFNTLEIGQETPCRFWAHYELSDKENKAGNPYKDVVTLEPVDKPATTTSVDNSAILGELRAIKALLQRMVLPYPEPARDPGPAGLDEPEDEPEPERKPARKPKNGNGNHSWPARHVQAILCEHLAENAHQAVGMLNKSNLTDDASPMEVISWARAYRAERDGGAASDRAAETANGHDDALPVDYERGKNKLFKS